MIKEISRGEKETVKWISCLCNSCYEMELT